MNPVFSAARSPRSRRSILGQSSINFPGSNLDNAAHLGRRCCLWGWRDERWRNAVSQPAILRALLCVWVTGVEAIMAGGHKPFSGFDLQSGQRGECGVS